MATCAADPRAVDGGTLFRQQGCFACHGEMGHGGVGPRLSDDPMLAIDQYVVAQILIGRGIMPAFDSLPDEQIAAVATYVRNSWGNHFGPVAPQLVVETRKLMKGALQTAVEPRK